MRYLLNIGFLLVYSFGMSQETALTYSSVEVDSYQYYMQEDYDQLNALVNKSLKEDIDFLDLRLRIGILSYQNKKFTIAVKHFEAAYKMSPADTLIQEYLYYSYLSNDQSEEAFAFSKNLEPAMQNKLKTLHYKGNYFSMNTGLLFTNAKQLASNNYLSTNKSASYLMNTSFYKLGINTKWMLSNRLQWYNALSYYRLNSIGEVDLIGEKRTANYSNNYLQWNSALVYQFKHGWVGGIGYGFYRSNSDWLDVTLNTPPMKPVFNSIPTTMNSHSFSLLVGKRIGTFYPTVAIHQSNFGNDQQNQMEANLTYYPLKNNQLYLTSSYSFIQSITNQSVFGQKIGGYIHPKWLIEVESIHGNLANRIGSLGFSTFNTGDEVKSHSGISLNYFNKNKQFTFSYYIQSRTTTMITTQSPTESTSTTQKYFANNFSIQIKWNY